LPPFTYLPHLSRGVSIYMMGCTEDEISVLPEVFVPKVITVSVLRMYTCIVTVHIYVVLLCVM